MPPRRSTDRPSPLSRVTAARLSQYLRCVAGRGEQPLIASRELADAVGVSDAQVRRDLASLGHLGQRGVGYDAASLAAAIRQALGIDRVWRVVVIGAGNLGRALLRYQGFREQGFHIVGLFDNDPHKVGTLIDTLSVEAINSLSQRLSPLRAELGVLAVPSEAAQPVADILVKAGVRGLLNFAPVILRLPEDVRLVTVDMAIQLEQLAYLVHRRQTPELARVALEPPDGLQ